MTSRVEELQRMCDNINENGGLDSGEWHTALLAQIAQNLAVIADVMMAERKDEPSNSEKPNNSTISKMEQVEQRSCDTCKNRDVEGWKNPCLGCTGFAFYEPKDEPQKHCHRPNNVACHPEQGDMWCRGCDYWYANEPQTEREGE